MLLWLVKAKGSPVENGNSPIVQVLCMFNQGGSSSLRVVSPRRETTCLTESKSTWKLEECHTKMVKGLGGDLLRAPTVSAIIT